MYSCSVRLRTVQGLRAVMSVRIFVILFAVGCSGTVSVDWKSATADVRRFCGPIPIRSNGDVRQSDYSFVSDDRWVALRALIQKSTQQRRNDPGPYRTAPYRALIDAIGERREPLLKCLKTFTSCKDGSAYLRLSLVGDISVSTLIESVTLRDFGNSSHRDPRTNACIADAIGRVALPPSGGQSVVIFAMTCDECP